MKKYAVLSMDIEDWYHLDYFTTKKINRSYSMLDGLTNYVDLLNYYGIKSTFFTLSELTDSAKEQILYAANSGHEIACHGKNHARPQTIDIVTFEAEIAEAKETLSNLVGKEIKGYRAPCYSIDRERFDIIRKLGFKYDSSKIAFYEHPLYGEIALNDFEQPVPGVYCKDGFYEFELPTKSIMGINVPVSGGGYIRILPWLFMKPIINSFLSGAQVYVLYIHPFELSRMEMPKVKNTTFLTNVRARTGLGHVDRKLEQLIQLIKTQGYEFLSFERLREKMIRKSMQISRC